MSDYWDGLRWFRKDEMFVNAEGFQENSFPYPELMDERMMLKLDKARDIAGIPFCITSSHRFGDEGAHGRGLAVDIRAHGNWDRLTIFLALREVGFIRFGIYDRHIHADTDHTLPPGMWGGISD